MKYGSYIHQSVVSQICSNQFLYDKISLIFAYELLHTYVTWISTMYYSISLWNVIVLTGFYFAQIRSLCHIFWPKFTIFIRHIFNFIYNVILHVLCKFTYFTYLTPLRGFAGNFWRMFLGWIPTKSVKTGVPPLFLFLNILCILANSLNIFYLKPLTINHSYTKEFVWFEKAICNKLMNWSVTTTVPLGTFINVYISQPDLRRNVVTRVI